MILHMTYQWTTLLLHHLWSLLHYSIQHDIPSYLNQGSFVDCRGGQFVQYVHLHPSVTHSPSVPYPIRSTHALWQVCLSHGFGDGWIMFDIQEMGSMPMPADASIITSAKSQHEEETITTWSLFIGRGFQETYYMNKWVPDDSTRKAMGRSNIWVDLILASCWVEGKTCW